MVAHQGLGIVEQQLARQTAEMLERPLNALQPCRLPLVRESLDIDPARVAERRHEQAHLAIVATFNDDPALAEIDL